MAGGAHVECVRRSARDPDLLLAHLERRRALGRQITGRIDGIDTFDEQILRVGAGVGEAPGYGAVVPQHDRGYARQGRPDQLEARRLEVGEIPHARRLQAEMRIVGEQRPAGERSSWTDHPGVGADPARLGRRQHRREPLPGNGARQLDQGDRRAFRIGRPDVGDLLCRQSPGEARARARPGSWSRGRVPSGAARPGCRPAATARGHAGEVTETPAAAGRCGSGGTR